MKDTYYNMDCIAGAKAHIPDGVVDLVITDPPFAIEGDQLHRLYNRKEEHVVEGYVEVSRENYRDFSFRWMEQAKRVLKDTGCMYIVSGWTNLLDILLAIEHNGLEVINHIIWKYSFGVSTKNKFVTSHYHILYCKKSGCDVKFNPYCRFGAAEKDQEGSSMLYCDLEDVWVIGREYKKGRIRNKNELPVELLKKMILYSSEEGDLVCDFFLGSFSSAKVARSLGRYSTGFEINESAYLQQVGHISNIERGWMLAGLRSNEGNPHFNQRKRWTKEEMGSVVERYHNIKRTGVTDRQAYAILSQEFGRGYFSMMNIIKKSKSARSPY
ncbi:DNA-methyltransferase [Methanolobus chelungpuianus]|uniref:DNA modification methylase n=1 Tax=Methanolobus chelungpuianus TaxID=502115 RepID=A0AAE3H7N6_9EURY|nr:site-specific DNA-methyltransferase [Methanolobus chelungpuianus]MCQ6961892.1 DNA modification methylase [Methanolobus chelungpuianus]